MDSQKINGPKRYFAGYDILDYWDWVEVDHLGVATLKRYTSDGASDGRWRVMNDYEIVGNEIILPLDAYGFMRLPEVFLPDLGE